ncbi:hypothetical protein [Natrialba aegyptia]|uniref:DUF8160 domain-containing protein n=1 Tax=Natrialba aegyptia DSM 13077 TaxID=1227491 RepID=M0ASS2_9EURY|nr:hypothetical protein [Natrialba aegyptia]ELZ01575.1 hypothetical protein C480_17857 [Natrialba aegyptia DSM 13077]
MSDDDETLTEEDQERLERVQGKRKRRPRRQSKQGKQEPQEPQEEQSPQEEGNENENQQEAQQAPRAKQNQMETQTAQSTESEQEEQAQQATLEPVTQREHDTFYLSKDVRAELNAVYRRVALDVLEETGIDIENQSIGGRNRYFRPLALLVGARELQRMSSDELLEMIEDESLVDDLPAEE